MPLQLENGTAGVPALQWTSTPTTGIFLSGTDIAFSVGGTTRMTVNSTGQIGFADGSGGAPSLRFTNDSTTGFYRSGSGQVGLTSSGTSKAIFGSTSQTSPIITLTHPLAFAAGEFNFMKLIGGQAFGGGYQWMTHLTTIGSAAPHVICTPPAQGGSLILVSGTDGSGPGHVFLDLVLGGRLLTPQVVASYAARGTPGARTYSLSGSSVAVAIAGATSYNVHAMQWSMPFGLG